MWILIGLLLLILLFVKNNSIENLSTSPGTLYQIRAVGVENKHLYAHAKDAIPSLSSGYPDYYWNYTPYGHSKNGNNLTYYQSRIANNGYLS